MVATLRKHPPTQPTPLPTARQRRLKAALATALRVAIRHLRHTKSALRRA